MTFEQKCTKSLAIVDNIPIKYQEFTELYSILKSETECHDNKQ